MKILAIGAHPDDMEFGCGGTLLKLAQHNKAKIHLLVITNGEVGGPRELRRKEQERAATLLGAKLYWGGFLDTNVPLTKALIDCVETYVKEIKPDLIFTHYFGDTHQDHRKVSQATTTATRYIRNVLFYEVPTTYEFNPSVFTDIGPVLNKKHALLRSHRSQVYQTKIPNLSIYESAKSTAMYRGYQNRVKFSEGFVPLRLSLDFVI